MIANVHAIAVATAITLEQMIVAINAVIILSDLFITFVFYF
jgi:hypothetical protein